MLALNVTEAYCWDVVEADSWNAAVDKYLSTCDRGMQRLLNAGTAGQSKALARKACFSCAQTRTHTLTCAHACASLLLPSPTSAPSLSLPIPPSHTHMHTH
eukprot:447388-Pelagomonas_calceolata.AAC.2